MIFLLLSINASAAPHEAVVPALQNLPQHPEWQITEANRAKAEGAYLQSTAPFTPTIQGSMSTYDGKYNRDTQHHSIAIDTPLGINLTTGWQKGVGTFPSYDAYETVNDGELRLATSIPLLDGLRTNSNQTFQLIQELGIDLAEFEQRDIQLQLILKTEHQFWKWQKSLALQCIAQQNVDFAQRRQDVFEKKLKLGAVSRLSVIDNQRELEERKQFLATMQQESTVQYTKFQYYWRDDNGYMTSDDMPTDVMDWNQIVHPVLPNKSVWSVDNIKNRPDVLIFDVLLQQLDVDIRLARNKRLPKVDLTMTYDHAISDAYQSEGYMGLKYEYAPLMKYERGKLNILEAKRNATELYKQKTIEKAITEITALYTQWEQLQVQVHTQQTVVELAEEALRLERIRFDNGGSDLLNLLKRENNLLKAQSTLIKISANLFIVEAMWRNEQGQFPKSIPIDS